MYCVSAPNKSSSKCFVTTAVLINVHFIIQFGMTRYLETFTLEKIHFGEKSLWSAQNIEMKFEEISEIA